MGPSDHALKTHFKYSKSINYCSNCRSREDMTRGTNIYCREDARVEDKCHLGRYVKFLKKSDKKADHLKIENWITS